MNADIENAIFGLELGSTRIKAVLIDEAHKPIASGEYIWENRYENGIWTYSLDEVLTGIRGCYRALADDVEHKYGERPRRFAAMGVSAMMHGYLVFDREGDLLTPFRTWRNTITEPAAQKLTGMFRFNIPQRWSIAHLYQAILNEEAHVPQIALLTTLGSYVHYLLTGENVIGVGDASAMFPYDRSTGDFDKAMVEQFDELITPQNYPWRLREILPRIRPAGVEAGRLTAKGAALLDETGTLEAGIPFCAPEGDAGTGMVSTGAVLPRTGSVSAGTSAFALLVLEKELKGCYPEIDVVATPSGLPVALVHTNTCTSDIDAWISLFAEVCDTMGVPVDAGKLFPTLYQKALEGEPDCGGLVNINYFSGEPITKAEDGRPLFVRTPDSRFTLPNFMRAQLYSAIAALKIGIDLLVEREHVEADRLFGHGGFFKTPPVGQQLLADALSVPILTMETAGEGGPWGMALLAAYMCRRASKETLERYLSEKVFAHVRTVAVQPDEVGSKGFEDFIVRYRLCLGAEKAVSSLR